VSADGNTLTRKFKDRRRRSAGGRRSEHSSREGLLLRSACDFRPVDPHEVNEYSEDALNATYKVDGNKVTWSGQGQTYTAEIGGPAVPLRATSAEAPCRSRRTAIASRRLSLATERS
jgi:hypothetical protein